MKNDLFGFGCMRLPLLNKDDPTSFDYQLIEEMFDEYLQRGYTYFDTAYVYHNHQGESVLKKCLVDRYPRSAFEIASKLPLREFNNPEDMERIFQEQLNNLGVEYIDYYLLHNMGRNVYQKCIDNDVFTFMLNKKKSKKIKHIGMSFHDSPELLEEILVKYGYALDFVQLQINYLDWESKAVCSKQCLQICKKYSKPVTVMETCKGGTLANLPSQAEALMKQYNPDSSVASWAFRFALGQSGVARVMSGMNSMEQVYDNLDTIDNYEPLNQEEYQIIAEVVEILQRENIIACTGCGYCAPGCPQNIAIPQYFELYNAKKKLGKGISSQNSYYQNLLKSGKGGASSCIECGQCEQSCPQHLPIKALLKDVSALFDKVSVNKNNDDKLCPVCKKHYFEQVGAYEICPVCGWEDDKIQRQDPDFVGGANKLSLNQAIKEYEKKN